MTGRRVLLTGAGGQLGQALHTALHGAEWDVTATTRSTLDLCDADAVRATIHGVAPDVVINAAAYTAVDAAEREVAIAEAVNAHAPAVLAEACRAIDARLVHYSTDYVFDGSARVPYLEDADTRPLGVYGATKRAGEVAILASGVDALILRTAWLYSDVGHNFVRTMLRLAANGTETVRVVSDACGTPTSCAFVALATVTMLDAGIDARGIFHLTASGATTWHDFAAAIFAGAAARGLTIPKLEAIPSSAYPTPAARPAYSVLDTTKLQRTFGIVPTPWPVQLDRVLDAYVHHT